MITSFKDLLLWKKADELAHKVFDISETFPSEYVIDLTNPLRRSALSIPKNIAEGCATVHTKKDFLQHLQSSRKSMNETQYLLLFAHERNLINEEEFNEFNHEYEKANRLLNDLIKPGPN